MQARHDGRGVRGWRLGLALAALSAAGPLWAADDPFACAKIQIEIETNRNMLGPKGVAAAEAELAACQARQAKAASEAAAAAANPETPTQPAFPSGFRSKFHGILNVSGRDLRVEASVHQANAKGAAGGVLTERDGARRSHAFVIGKTGDGKCRLLFAAGGPFALRGLTGGCVMVAIQAVAPDHSADLQLYRSSAP